MHLNKNHSGFVLLVYSLVLSCLFSFSAFSQTAAKVANRQTALRCLQLAKTYINQNLWDSVDAQVEMGLAYDDTVADLWYLQAVSKTHSKSSRSEILPLVQHSLSEGEWVDYNRDSARILYADILSDTGFYKNALSVLDEQPFLFSADAEYIRIKAYYRLHSDVELEKARERVDSDRKIYSSDSRFARLFFKNEYVLLNKDEEMNPLVRKIADSFISMIPKYADTDSELELYAALFANGENLVRMLQSFDAKEYSHPLYAIAALEAGIMTQAEAVEYFIGFCDDSISLENLVDFSSLLTEEEPKAFFAEYLLSYNGLITVDTDNDLEPNLFVDYVRGRPQKIRWDRNNYGVYDWTSECDFGVPLTVSVMNQNLQVGYSGYPFVNNVSWQNEDGRTLKASFVNEQFTWEPFSIIALPSLSDYLGIEFFVPVVYSDIPTIDLNVIEKSALSVEVDSKEYEGAVIHFSMLNGLPQTADYLLNGKRYAQAFFENGIPVSRVVDKNDDGVFETIETFAIDTDGKMNLSKKQSAQLMINLYGIDSDNKGLYLKMIQIDQNADTNPDFTEEYLADNGKITTWDSDNDGSWDVRYIRYPQKLGENLLEDSMFYLKPNNVLTTVCCSDGEPDRVISDKIEYSVTRGEVSGFYWVGSVGTSQNEKKAVEALQNVSEQGLSVVVEDEGTRIIVVRIGEKSFGKIILPLDDENTELENVDATMENGDEK